MRISRVARSCNLRRTSSRPSGHQRKMLSYILYGVSIEGLPYSEGIKQRWIPGCPAQASHLDPDFWESDYGT